MNSLPDDAGAVGWVERVNDAYSHFRASYWALLVFGIAFGAALIAHYVFGWDKDWGNTNLYISVSTEINTVLTIIHASRAQRYQEHLLEAMHAMILKSSEDK